MVNQGPGHVARAFRSDLIRIGVRLDERLVSLLGARVVRRAITSVVERLANRFDERIAFAPLLVLDDHSSRGAVVAGVVGHGGGDVDTLEIQVFLRPRAGHDDEWTDVPELAREALVVERLALTDFSVFVLPQVANL